MWTIKDLLAHLHAWHKLLKSWYEAGMEGRKAEMPAAGYRWTQTPLLNQQIFEAYKDADWEDIVAALEESHRETLSIAAKHTDTELFARKQFGWTGTTSMAAYLIAATSSHYQWATDQIRRAKRQGKV
jgi:hypothetical protein